jgi:predicted metal-dependent phosphoesterase TrpH
VPQPTTLPRAPHIRSIRNNKDDSAFAQHILNTGHLYGPMEQIMEIVERARKGRIMNIKENFYIYLFNYINKLIQEQKQIKAGDRQNSLFDLVVKHNLPQQLHHYMLGYKYAHMVRDGQYSHKQYGIASNMAVRWV